ncbi:MAG TPA: c-type cytochrome [Vicinamibacterales bacterium]|nr:c-type cytochrome [Vicinamibacterales bacterium]
MSLRRLLTALAVLIALLAGWWLARPLSEVQRHRRHLAALQRQVDAARDSRAARASSRGRVMRLRAQARTSSGAQRAAFEAEAAAIEAGLGWNDRAAVRAAVLAAPLVDLARSTPDPAGVVPTSSPNGSGCIACHVAIATAGFENYPAPFRTHPALASYVGAASSHPPSRVACAACHLGDGRATTFSGAGHASLRGEARDAVGPDRTWVEPTAAGAMLPVGRVEGACVACHAGERYQPGAPALNEALVTLDRGGCYACHDLPGLEPASKRGPDLRRIGAKLSQEWVKAWLANPRAIKPTTWMPRFWTGDALSADDTAAIDAVAAYLFANSAPYTPVPAAPAGDAARGRALVESVGCFGCHVNGGEGRDQTPIRRTFGQPLEAIGTKTTYTWLADWVREPSRYSPDTRMPSLRLTPGEASDAAAYLATLRRDPAPAAPPGPADDAAYRRVVDRYADPSGRDAADARSSSGEALRTLAGRIAIDALGCFNCHAIAGFEGRRRAAPIAPRTVWLDADARAAHAPVRAAGPGVRLAAPEYDLGPTEASRIALGLTAVAGRISDAHAIGVPWHTVKVSGRTLVQERNCVGCHTLEGVGGDIVALFAEPTPGPPLLTPEGSRVRPEWLRGFLRQPATIRPWLSVRMPTFNLTDDEIDRIGNYLRAVAPENPRPGRTSADTDAAVGKVLFDLLKCQQCHVLGAIPGDQPTSNLAPDLRLARQRLQPDWILGWLRHPSAILPGTRMPTFWPDYPASFYAPLDRDGASQVQAIRDHVLTLR